MSRCKKELWILKTSICMNRGKTVKERKIREGGDHIDSE